MILSINTFFWALDCEWRPFICHRLIESLMCLRRGHDLGLYLSAHIQPNPAKLIGRHFTVQMDNDTHCQGHLRSSHSTKIEHSLMAKPVTCSQPNGATFQLLKTPMRGRKTHKTSRNWRWLQWKPDKVSSGEEIQCASKTHTQKYKKCVSK